MLSKELAKSLLEIKAVSIVDENNLFTWVSGIKSPVYCDNRLTISYPEVRRMIANGFSDLIKKECPDVQVIAGTATAGIPHAAWVAEILNLPMVYVRSSAKAHGKQNQIEGTFDASQKVVLIEDLFSTGGSSLKAVEALQEAGANVVKTYSIFSYNFEEVKTKFDKLNIPFKSLTDYNTLLPIAAEMGYIESEKVEMLKEWSKNPKMFM